MSTTEKCRNCFNKCFLKECACGCGTIITERSEYHRFRMYAWGHNLLTKHGSEHPSWKGGRQFSSHGYAKVWSPNNLNADADGYVYEHVLQMQKFLCRSLTSIEVVHHKNGIKDDNRLNNLELMTSSTHMSHHGKKQESQRRDLSKRHIEHFHSLWKWLTGKTITGRLPRRNYVTHNSNSLQRQLL